jgi:flavin-dependent dehydrogenase
MRTTEHAVVIAGGGPAGMMLAAELALAKVDVAVVERRPDHVLAGSRAGGLLTRTIEVLDQRGVADRFLAEGQVHQAMPFGTAMLDMSDLPTRHPYFLGIFQNEIERIMAAWIAELPVRIYYGSEVTGFAQDDTGVDVELSDDRSLRPGRAVAYPAAGARIGIDERRHRRGGGGQDRPRAVRAARSGGEAGRRPVDLHAKGRARRSLREDAQDEAPIATAEGV